MKNNEIREIVKRLDEGGTASVDDTIAALKAAGAVKSCHLDAGRELTPEETVEWYAGQGLNILEEKAFYAVNSFINCLDKFCPEEKP